MYDLLLGLFFKNIFINFHKPDNNVFNQDATNEDGLPENELDNEIKKHKTSKKSLHLTSNNKYLTFAKFNP